MLFIVIQNGRPVYKKACLNDFQKISFEETNILEVTVKLAGQKIDSVEVAGVAAAAAAAVVVVVVVVVIVIVYSVSQKKSPLRFSVIFSETVGTF